MIKALYALLCACALSGCSAMFTPIEDTPSSPDWPVLKVESFVVEQEEVARRCPKTLFPLACMTWNFSQGWCRLYFTAESIQMPAVVEHERLHCKGHDHPGETQLRDAWSRYKASKTGSQAAPSR